MWEDLHNICKLAISKYSQMRRKMLARIVTSGLLEKLNHCVRLAGKCQEKVGRLCRLLMFQNKKDLSGNSENPGILVTLVL